MSAPPFMPLYVADYLGDTRHLTTEQHGAYLLLLMAMWRAGGKIPAEGAKLARICGLTPARWARLEEDVLAFFQVEEGDLVHRRMEKEFMRYTETSEKRRASGSKGGRPKSLKSNDTDKAIGLAGLKPEEPNQNQNQNQKEEGRGVVTREGWNGSRLDGLDGRLREAAGACLNAASPALLKLADIIALLEPREGEPCDLEADVLPALRAVSQTARPGSVGSWAFFRRAVLENRDRRLTASPEPEIRHDRQPSHAHGPRPSSREAGRSVWAAIAAEENAARTGRAGGS